MKNLAVEFGVRIYQVTRALMFFNLAFPRRIAMADANWLVVMDRNLYALFYNLLCFYFDLYGFKCRTEVQEY